MGKNIKKPTTFKEQCELLKSRGVIIEDDAACVELLSRINYYRLSGYLLPFKENDKYNVSFETLQSIYYFDTELRSLIFDIIETIELHLQTQISYYFAHKYGALGYKNPDNFGAKHDPYKFAKTINKCVRENNMTAVVKHHNEVYDGNFPLWVIIEFFTLGRLSVFYSDMTTADKDAIAFKLYDVHNLTMSSWLKCLTVLRNRCAHYSRLYYWKFTSIPKIPPHVAFTANRRLFSQLLMLKMMYPYPDRWNEDFYMPLTNIFNKYGKYVEKNT